MNISGLRELSGNIAVRIGKGLNESIWMSCFESVETRLSSQQVAQGTAMDETLYTID